MWCERVVGPKRVFWAVPMVGMVPAVAGTVGQVSHGHYWAVVTWVSLMREGADTKAGFGRKARTSNAWRKAMLHVELSLGPIGARTGENPVVKESNNNDRCRALDPTVIDGAEAGIRQEAVLWYTNCDCGWGGSAAGQYLFEWPR